MYLVKKANYDLLLLILLALRIELNSDIIRYRSWNRVSVSRSVRLGSTSAYTQTSLSNSYLRYPHPKGLDQNELEEAAILYSRLNYINSVPRNRENLITCIVNSPEEHAISQGNEIVPTTPENEARDLSVQNIPDVGASAVTELSNAFSETLELTPEEMDLIEILWKQDIDLGVSRDAYDSRQTVENEKLKEFEFTKDKDIFDHKDLKPSEEPIPLPNPFQGLNYTIDSETGEYLIAESSNSDEGTSDTDPLQEFEFSIPDKNKRLENELLKETESLDSLNLDSFLPFDDDFCDISELFSPSELPDFLTEDFNAVTEDFNAESDYFLPQSEDVEKELEQFKILNDTVEIDSNRGEMYPNIEDCWPDATTMMPLIALGNPYQQSFPPLQNSLATATLSPSEGLIVQASIPSAETDFQPISPTLGTSSIGYAVAESIATLTNDSDPVPSSSISHNLYGTEIPELLYPNHTSVSHTDIISDLFLDELQLMSLPTNDSIRKQRDDHMDTNSDSISSGHLPSVSDYHDFIDSCSESSSHNDEEQNRCELLVSSSQIDGYFPEQTNCDVPQASGTSSRRYKQNTSRHQSMPFSDASIQQGNSNDQQFFTLKSYYSDPSENSACAVSCGDLDLNKRYDYTLPKGSTYNNTGFFQHNHTYHIPFHSDDSCHKPVLRDKQKSQSDDEISNKDEKKAKELKLPISISDIINLAIEEYNERLSKYELTDAQLTLIRDIRRRGKNKVAAQNCRKRKMDQINSLQHDLDFLQNEKLKLKSKQSHLLQEKNIIEEKYIQLYELIYRNTNSRPPNVPTNLSVSNDNSNATSDALIGNINSSFHGGARTKRKFKK